MWRQYWEFLISGNFFSFFILRVKLQGLLFEFPLCFSDLNILGKVSDRRLDNCPIFKFGNQRKSWNHSGYKILAPWFAFYEINRLCSFA